MTIRYTCADCGSHLKIEDTLAGTNGHCPKCQAAFTVPQPSGSKLLAVAGTGTGPPGEADGDLTDGSLSDEDFASALLSDEPPARSGDDRPAGGARDAVQPIRYTCSACGSQLTIRPDRAGTKGRCPKCRAKFIVPGSPQAGGDPAADEAESTTETSGPGESPRMADKPRRGVAKSDEPQLPSSMIASMYLKENARGESHAHGSSAYEAPPRRRPGEKEPIDWAGMAKYFARTLLPGLVGIVVLSMGTFWLASTVIKGSPKRPPLGRVTGTVTLDGEPLAGALVTFRPQMEKIDDVPVSESVGRTDPSGEYSLVYVQDIDGAAVGEHRVEINATDARGAEILAPVHHAQSTRIVNVESGSNTFDFELKSNP